MGCTSLKKVVFSGNAPSVSNDSWEYVFANCSPDLTLYYYPNATGFTTPDWHGYACYPLSSEETEEVQIDTLPQEQQTAAQSKVMAAIGIPSLNENQKLTYYDIQLVNPVTGEVYTKDNFPSEGIDVLIPYPDGMTKDNNTYRLFHFPNGVDGEMVEVTPLVLTDAGIQFHVDSLSPFALLSEQVTQSTTVTGTTTVSDTTKPPKTGDSSMDVTFLAILAIVAGSSCAATVIYRKRHHKA
jgi:hypothetical protein